MRDVLKVLLLADHWHHISGSGGLLSYYRSWYDQAHLCAACESPIWPAFSPSVPWWAHFMTLPIGDAVFYNDHGVLVEVLGEV
jgi:hypothetical protein